MSRENHSKLDDLSSSNELSLPNPTCPKGFQVSLQGFQDEAQARKFGHLLANTITEISRYINLERLDGVTVAHDYEAAIRTLDRGFQASRPLARTAEDLMLGVAMMVPVKRDQSIKGHLVFLADVVIPLSVESGQFYDRALYCVAHECGHLEDFKCRDECFPQTMLQPYGIDQEKAHLDAISEAIWMEYAACFIAARFGREETIAYQKNFLSTLASAPHDAKSAIRSYRIHGVVARVLEEAGGSLCTPLRMAAYLLGHLDGLGEDWFSMQSTRSAVMASEYHPFLERLVSILRDLWSRRGRWNSRAEFSTLSDLIRDLHAHGGLVLKKMPDGSLWVDIPRTPEMAP